jgi:cytochrome oxidase Cu insertion factor (SCO1/SenC/PrrC family)
MYHRVNRYKKKKNRVINNIQKSIPFFSVSGIIVLFIVIIVIGSTPSLKKDLNKAVNVLGGEDNSDYKSDITFKTIDGESIKLEDHQGEVVIVFFFGAHCSGCPDQADILGDIDDDYSSSVLFIVPVCLDMVDDTSDSELRAFLKDRQSSWPAIRDTPQYDYATFFDIKYKPTVKILDKDGNVEKTMVGSSEGSYNNIKKEVDSLL